MLKEIDAKTLIIKQKHPDYWFNFQYNMNLYKGCCHGCIYCDSRSDCYHIENFDQIKVKKNALSIIEKELQTKRMKGTIGTGSMSDPYNPFEKEYQLTKKALILFKKYGFGVGICTKSDMVTRDMDILKDIQKKSMVMVNMTITTPEDTISRKIEPFAPLSSKRFDALRRLREHNIYAGILMMPLLPFITGNANNVKEIVKKAASINVPYIYPSFGLTLREGNREYFYQQLDQHYPGMKKKFKLVYGNAYLCEIEEAKKVAEVFFNECEKFHIIYRMKDIIKLAKEQVDLQQITFF